MLGKILPVTFMLGFCFSEIIHTDSLEDYDAYLNHGVRRVLEFKENSGEERKVDVLAKVFKKNFGLLKMQSLKLDIVFLIDASSSVGENNFQSELKFVKKVLSDVTVDANNTRIAVVTFSSPSNVIKSIDEIGTTAEGNNKCKLLNQDLKEVNYQGGQTFTLGAFEVAKDIFISSTRSDSQKVLFLITDGYSNGGDPTPLAKELKIQNITIFTIGIQNGNYKELFEISSPPGQFHSYLLDSFSDFESLARKALHADLTSGEYVPTSNYKLCDHLCKTGHCCDINAICTCGTSSGHYTCLCQQGFYGSGLRNSCFRCESGTYSEGPNECLPCPDPNHMTIYPAFSIDDCECKAGYMPKEGGCEEITCPEFAMPENSYLVDSINCTNKVNGICEIRCEAGYDLIGESKLVCQSDGLWSYSGLRCQAQKCTKLEPPKDGIVDCVDTNTGQDYIFDKEDMKVPIDVTCSFRCTNGRILIGSEKRTCIPPGKWDGIKSACKHIKCNKLPQIKYGTIDPSSCLDGKQEVGKVCKISCDEGFKLRGPSEKRCVGGYGQWDSDFSTSVCIDTEPPKIACPDNKIGTTLPGKMFGHVFWKEPVVTDNSGLNISVWVKPAIANIASFKFQIGATMVAYYAQDAFQNRAQCSFKVIIKDEEPPTIEGCIDPPPFLTSGSEGVNVTWVDPNIFDNSQKVQVEKSREFGYFGKGTTTVIYIAKDPSQNRNICKLNITVEESACEALADPENGQSDCTSDNEHMRCIVTCDEGYGIPMGQPEEISDGADNNFICGTNDDLMMYANDDPLYPECTVTVVPDDEFGEGEIDLNVDDCYDEKELNEKIKKVALSLNGYCAGGCDINTSLPDCYDESPSIVFKRSINYQPVPHRNKKQKGKVNVKFQVRGRYVNENGISNFTLRLPGGYNATIRHFEKKFICPKGFAPRKNRCVQCPKGSFLNATRSKCQSCDFGQYNDKLGQESCTVCPLHYSTMKIHSKKIEDCKEECPPGSHARRKRFRPSKSRPNEVIERLTLQPNCRSCAIGYYQSEYGQLRCKACPSGYTTFAAGARDSTQCVATAKEMCKVNGICGYGLCIEINEYQYSCNCFQNYIGTNCEIRINYCDSNPCYNGGTCSNEDKGFKCKCRYRFRGKYCEEADECNRTCLNGGKCVQDDSGSPMCICLPGFTGKVCENKIKHCKSGLCSNNSECIEEYDTFKCQCLSGFIGRRCNLLPCDFRPCSEEKRCINLMGNSSVANNYRCLCPEGYTGEDCNQLVDACESSPCLNGGICINYVHYYKCNCPGLYTGPHCEHKKRTNYVLSFEQYETHNYVKLDGFGGNISEVYSIRNIMEHGFLKQSIEMSIQESRIILEKFCSYIRVCIW
nr:unnamed protein product [Callosobruchus chinensis]